MPVVLLLIAAIIGTGAVSSTAKPGEVLFPVKLTIENLQETVTLDPKAKAELQAEHALARLKEVRANIANGHAQGLATAIANLEEKIKGAADTAEKTGDVTLATKIKNQLLEIETEIEDATESEVTDSTDDSLLSDAKDLLEVEKHKLLAKIEPTKEAEHLQEALEAARKEASESAKKVESFKSGSSKVDSSEKSAIETHNSIIEQETKAIEQESSGGSGSSGSGSGGSGSGSGGSGSGR